MIWYLLVFLSFFSVKAHCALEKFSLYETVREVPQVKEDNSWSGFSHLGDVSGLSVDGDGNLHIFHRGDRHWDALTFDDDNHIMDESKGPIHNDTVIVVDANNGKVLYTWGSNRFYMPHGLTVDRHGNSWVTDVGLHQVFKFPPRENNYSLSLGEPFVSGSGRNHFCKPTDVAVIDTGYFFVSDGYCNSRVLLFSPEGSLMKIIGAQDGMNIPHSLTMAPEYDALFVADRENARILCYALGLQGSQTGSPIGSIEGKGIGRVFALDKQDGELYIINGPDLWENNLSVSSDIGLVIDINSGTPKTVWRPKKGFSQPHDLAVSPDGRFAFVSEIDLSAPKKVYKFIIWN